MVGQDQALVSDPGDQGPKPDPDQPTSGTHLVGQDQAVPGPGQGPGLILTNQEPDPDQPPVPGPGLDQTNHALPGWSGSDQAPGAWSGSTTE